MRVILVRDPRELVRICAIFLDVDLRNASEQLREHEIAVFRLFEVIISGRAEHVAAVERRHRFLLFRADYQQLRASWGGDPARYRGYDAWVERANNAFFGTQAAYDELVPALEALFRREGSDWQRFYDAARQLAELPKSERHQKLKEAAGG